MVANIQPKQQLSNDAGTATVTVLVMVTVLAWLLNCCNHAVIYILTIKAPLQFSCKLNSEDLVHRMLSLIIHDAGPECFLIGESC